MLKLKLNGKFATLLLLTDMQGGNHGAEKKLMHETWLNIATTLNQQLPIRKHLEIESNN